MERETLVDSLFFRGSVNFNSRLSREKRREEKEREEKDWSAGRFRDDWSRGEGRETAEGGGQKRWLVSGKQIAGSFNICSFLAICSRFFASR